MGAKELLRSMREFSMTDLEQVSAHIVQRSSAAMQRQIDALPDGEYRNSMRVDGYGRPIDIECLVVIEGAHIHIDFSGTSAPSDKGINVPLNYTEAYASFGVRCVVGNDIPNNAGSLAAISVTAPADSILGACSPAAVSARHALGQMLPDVILGALAEILPQAIPAEGAACIWNPVFLSDPAGQTANSRQSFVINPIFNGGTGARPVKDGLSTTAFPSGVRTTPTEINEVTAPLIVWHREFEADSGGAGEFRGGLGQRIEIEHARGEAFFISRMFDRINHPARGRAGGACGASGWVGLSDGTVLSGKGKDKVPAGQRLVMITPGGGGFGQPELRAPAALERDEQSGLVGGSLTQALHED
jgi:N-methylhydantoinase B